MSFLFGGGTTKADQQTEVYAGLRVQSSAYGRVIPVLFGRNRIAGNVIWYGDFLAIPMAMGGGKGGGGGGKGGPSGVTWYYWAAYLIGLCEGPCTSIDVTWASKALYANPGAAFASFTAYGSYPQTPWSWLSTNHPDQSLGYNGLAMVGWSPNVFIMSQSDTIPNYSFAVTGPYSQAGSYGHNGAKVSDIITAILTDAKYGLGLSVTLDMTDFANYCQAMGMMLSPVYDAQAQAGSVIQNLLDLANAELVLHDGATLKVVPYTDTDITGNGATWTADLTPQYDLTVDDFICEAGDEPIVIKRKDQADCYNWQPIEFIDELAFFNADSTEAYLQGEIDRYGLRMASTIDAKACTEPALARKIAALKVQRSAYVKNEYEFTLSWRYCRLEGMDLVTLTYAPLGLNRTLVRIREIREDDRGKLNVVAEEVPVGSAAPAVYGTATKDGYSSDHNVNPGNTNVPVIITAPSVLAPREMWIAASGGANWGGCEVWASSDNATYALAGRILAPSRHGVLSALLATGSDPDVAHTLSVDLSASKGELVSGTQADADAKTTLCLVEDELIAYQTATLTSQYHYDLTYLRRGCYNSPIAQHAQNAPFLRLDGNVFRYVLEPNASAGDTVYLKFLSFNIFGQNTQSAGDVSPYTVTIGQGASYPSDVTGFAANQNGDLVVFSWTEVSDPDLDGYEVRFNPQGVTDWASAAIITMSARGTHLVSAHVGPGKWTFLIAARNQNGRYSRTIASATLTVINTNFIIAGGTGQSTLGWPGNVGNFIRHVTGVLTPKSQGHAVDDGWDTFGKFCPQPYATYEYEAPEFDLGSNRGVRAVGTIEAYLGPGETGVANPALQLKYHKDGEAYGAYEGWTLGVITARCVTEKLVMTTSVGLCYIKEFTPTLDGQTYKQQATGVAVSGTGLDVTYPTPFSQKPYLTVTPVGTTLAIANPSAETAAGFHVDLYGAGGAQIAGTINWIAEGV